MKVEVVNAGVAGYSSSNELLYLLSELVHYSPDLVIVYNGWNDAGSGNQRHFDILNPFNSLKTDRYYELDGRLAKLYSASGSFSLFAGAASESFSTALSSTATGSALIWLAKKLKSDSTPRETSWSYNPRSVDLYREHLAMDIMVSREYGFKIGIFLQPIMGVDNKAYTPAEKDLFKLFLVDLERRKGFYADAIPMLEALKHRFKGDDGVCIADLSRAFEKVQQTVYADEGHLLVSGNDVVASRILDELGGCGFFH